MQGVCFHLYSKARSSGLAEYQLPELQRSPLDELSLQARLHAAGHDCHAIYCLHMCRLSTLLRRPVESKLLLHSVDGAPVQYKDCLQWGTACTQLLQSLRLAG